MNRVVFLLFSLLLLACNSKDTKEEIDPDPNYLRNTQGEITMKLDLYDNRWGTADLNVILTLKNAPTANKELEKYLQNVGGQEAPVELSVDWGDGTVNSETAHTYAEHGTYKIIIKGRGINWFSDEKINHRAIISSDLQKCPTLQGIIMKSGSGSSHPVDGIYSFHHYPYLEYLDFEQIIGVKKIDISKNKELKGFVTYNRTSDYGVDLSTIASLKFVTSVFSLENITFSQIIKNPNISYLSVQSRYDEIDFSSLQKLEELVITECSIKKLDLSENKQLKSLKLIHNHIHLSENCPYDDETVNVIYSKLPVVSGVLTTNIPFGDKSIAEKRGWKVVMLDQ